MIRKAVIDDVKKIHQLLSDYAKKDLLLARSLSELYDHLRDYFVIEGNGGSGISGVCALGICWEDLAEIRSLAVIEEKHGENYGTQLVKKCLDEAVKLGLSKVFTLTYVPDFFRKQGFREVEKSVLPHKVWADCLQCPKFPECDETAMMIEL